MTHLLRLDASSRPGPESVVDEEPSFSRTLADEIQAQIEHAAGSCKLVRRDLIAEPIPHIANNTIKGFYTPPNTMTADLRTATALSDELIAEVKAADTLLISSPIYNFGVPSALKAWADHVVRIGHTFSYENGEFQGLLSGKRAIVAYSYGAPGYGEGGQLQSYDFMKPYLTMILNFIGIEEVQSFAIEGTTGAPDEVAAAQVASREAVLSHFGKGVQV